MQPLHSSHERMFTERWAWGLYKDCPSRYVGSTNTTDIYLDLAGPEPLLIIVNGNAGDDSDWHWVKVDPKIKRLASCRQHTFPDATTPSNWHKRFMADRDNIEAYVRCFVPELAEELT